MCPMKKKDLPGKISFGEHRYRVVQQLKELKLAGSSTQSMTDNYYVILPDVSSINTILEETYQDSGMIEEYVREASSISYTLQSDMDGN